MSTTNLVDALKQKYNKFIAFPAIVEGKTFIFFTDSVASKTFVVEINPLNVEYTKETKKMQNQFRLFLGHMEIPVVQFREKAKEEE